MKQRKNAAIGENSLPLASKGTATGFVVATYPMNAMATIITKSNNLKAIRPFSVRALKRNPAMFIPYNKKTEAIETAWTPESPQPGNIKGAKYSEPIIATAAVETALLITIIQLTINAKAGW